MDYEISPLCHSEGKARRISRVLDLNTEFFAEFILNKIEGLRMTKDEFRNSRVTSMSYPKPVIKFLGLSKKEGLILGALAQKGPCLVSDLAREIKIPRTTAHFLLKKLSKRGLVQQIKVVNHKEWQIMTRERAVNNIKNLFLSFGFEKSTEILGRIETPALGIEILHGKKKIKECYRKIFEARQVNRVYFIQGNQSAELILKKIEKEYFFDFHKELKSRGIIMEGITGEYVLKLFKNLDVSELNSHLGRLVIGHIAPDIYVDFNIDIIMFKNIVVLINPEEENIIIFRNDSIAKVFKNFFELILEKSNRVDLNLYIKTLIKEKIAEKNPEN